MVLNGRITTLEDKVAGLRQTSIYPEHPSRIDAIETHMSWVFLTDNFVYKLKKPVRYDFLDFTSLEARRHDCNEEVRLNRRLAHDVYLGIVPLALDKSGRMSVDYDGEIVEWLVKMRRLPEDRLLDVMIKHKTLEHADINDIGHRLAAFYRQCRPVDLEAGQYHQLYIRQVRANLDALADHQYGLSHSLLGQISESLSGFLEHEHGLFTRRSEQGRIVEGHGDLRPEHICLESIPVIFDCLEFNYLFRIIDTIDEISFLAMECDLLGASEVGPLLIGVYADICNDHPPQRLISFYKACRACLRAKLSIWHVLELEQAAWPHWRERTHDYLRLAARYASQLM